MTVDLLDGVGQSGIQRSVDGRHVIRISESRRVDLVDSTIAALSEKEIFQRGGGLVDIVRDPQIGEGGVVVPKGEPRVRVTPFARVYELSTLACKFEQRKNDEKKAASLGQARAYSWCEVDPPGTIIKTLIERGEWAHIRPLDAMVSWPVLRPDGTVFSGPGYDSQTCCYSTAGLELRIPKRVSQQHVAESIAKIHDILCDFPFEKPEHRSAWLAALLTVLARPCIRGPVPMVIFDANDRGTGKTLLCDLIGHILTGKDLSRRSVPDKGSEDEWGKMMLGIGIGGYPILLFDNVKTTLRSATLDMVLTGEVFQGRVLGINREMRVPIRTLFLISSNNAIISTDLVRRSLHCRIVSQVERPERRTGWKHNLPGDAAAKRGELLSAALTILLGYIHAGRPKVQAQPLGSYGAWAAQVQSPMVWAGLPDPVLTQDALRDQADEEGEQLGTLLVAWYEFLGATPTTVRDALARASEESDKSQYGSANPKAVALMEAAQAVGDGRRPTTSQLGFRIRKWKDKWQNSMCFAPGPDKHGSTKWYVRRMGDG